MEEPLIKMRNSLQDESEIYPIIESCVDNVTKSEEEDASKSDEENASKSGEEDVSNSI